MTSCVHCEAMNPDDAILSATCGNQPTIAPPSRDRDDATRDVPAAVAANTGNRVAGRYEILGVLGRGGMGTVYRVRDHVVGEEMALKMLQGGVDAAEVERLRREVVTARKIAHANVIRLYDFGVAGGEGYLSMELLPGGTLADRQKKGILPYEEAMRIGIAISEALGAAHKVGIVHRDLKPLNVLFDADGTPKLVDFGLARSVDATMATVGFAGTPHYMSPEMADGREITVRSDVYSLGVLLFQLFTGVVPFEGDTLVRLVMLHTQQAPPNPRSIRPDLPPSLARLLLRCLEKDPAKRPPDAAAVAVALAAIARGESWDDEAPSRSRLPWVASVGGIVLVAAVAIGVRMLASRGAGVAMPSPTPIAEASTAAPTSTATVAPTATQLASRPSATPAPAATKLAAIATPRAAPAPGKLTVFARPWVSVFLDGKRIAETTPLKAAPISAGEHTVRLQNDATGFRAEKHISVAGGRAITIRVDQKAGTVSVE